MMDDCAPGGEKKTTTTTSNDVDDEDIKKYHIKKDTDRSSATYLYKVPAFLGF